jgi:peptidoglycan/xylan/chitin deacetylase (PgdA/CDA1 family)
MLLVPLYHRVDRRIQKHFLCFSQYGSLFPGEPLNGKINICITFDDATRDFYEVVFPLLKTYRLKALLAVPVAFVGKEGYCTWKELEEMSKSEFVKIASHSMRHPDMTMEGVNLEEEVANSKKNLEERLNVEVDTFVYPFGKFNRKVHKKVKEHYSYIMRIGMAFNRGWKNRSGLTYRISADFLDDPERLFKKKYFYSYWLNLLRGR